MPTATITDNARVLIDAADIVALAHELDKLDPVRGKIVSEIIVAMATAFDHDFVMRHAPRILKDAVARAKEKRNGEERDDGI